MWGSRCAAVTRSADNDFWACRRAAISPSVPTEGWDIEVGGVRRLIAATDCITAYAEDEKRQGVKEDDRTLR